MCGQCPRGHRSGPSVECVLINRELQRVKNSKRKLVVRQTIVAHLTRGSKECGSYESDFNKVVEMSGLQ